jgi:hypothetical protein
MKKCICLFSLLAIFYCSSFSQTTCFVDDISGNDSNKGTSPSTAWKSLKKLNTITFMPGDSILFRRGGKWKGNFVPKGSGKEGMPVVFDAFGNGTLPEIDAAGVIASNEEASYTIRLFNQEYIEFRNLKIKNYNPFEVPLPVKSEGNSAYAYSQKTGIYVEAKDAGTLKHIWFVGLELCDINGSMDTKDNGGILMEITWHNNESLRKPTRFEDVYLMGCYIHDVDRTGFSNTSVWWDRSLRSRWGESLGNGKTDNWFPSKKIIVRNNKFERTGANALIVRVAESPLVEYNFFNQCALKGNGNASFPFNCDNALFQYNEACYTVYNTEADSWDGKKDVDAGGFDSDWNCKNTVIQYNYSHHNGFGGILFCLSGGKVNFNDGTVIRYNIFEDNKNHVIRGSGPTTNTRVYNNLIYSGPENDSVIFIYHKSWGGYSDSTLYQNNIFVSKGQGIYFDLGKSTRNYFHANLFSGIMKDKPPDLEEIIGDPLFTDEKGVSGRNPWLRFTLQETSPAIDRGIPLPDHPEFDRQGIRIAGKPDIGPIECYKYQ